MTSSGDGTLRSAGLASGGKVAERAFVILVLVGIVEVLVGVLSSSIALVADGVHSFAGASVSLTVGIGLRFSKKAPDGRFHFGYYRVETLSSFVAAFLMAVLGAALLYESYLVWVFPRSIANAEMAMAAAAFAAAVGVGISLYTMRAGRRYGSLALKTNAFNSATDVFSAITAFFGIALNRYSGILHTDSLAGAVIAFFIFAVAYSVTREASLVLIDACQCEDVILDIQDVAEKVDRVKQVHSIRMRKVGPYMMGDMHVVVDGDITVKEGDEIAKKVEERVKAEFDEVHEIKVRIEPSESDNSPG